MRRSFSVTALAVAVSLFVADAAPAQEPKNPVGLFHLMSPIMGLESNSVRGELKLTDEQEGKAKAILEKVREARKKVGREGGGFRRLPKEEREARLAAFRKSFDAADKEMTALLSDEQMARYKQVRIWIEPHQALLCEEIIAELKLATVQTDALAAIFEKYRKKMLEVPVPDGTDEEKRRKARAQTDKLANEADAEYLGVLTKEQREKFEKMRGPKFEVDISEFPTIVGENYTK
jgi:Spy/CpxP family protein refolding chaperone